MEKKTSDVIIKAYEGWLTTINPEDFTITTSKGKQNAKDILDRMKNPGDEFGRNFKKSIYDVSKLIIDKNLKKEELPKGHPTDTDDEQHTFFIETSGEDGKPIQYNREQILQEIDKGSKFGDDFIESAIQGLIPLLFRA